MNESNEKNSLFELIIIIIAIISIMNIYIVVSNEIAIFENPKKSISDCRGLSYNGPNATKEKEKCLESIKEKEEKAIKAEEYIKTNKSTHTLISFILLLTTIITLIFGIRKKQKIGYIIIGIIMILVNIISLL